MKWLLSNKEFRSICAEPLDWMYEFLYDNGVICEEDATIQFIYASTDFDVPDCPFCGANDNRHYPLADNRWKCKKCKRKFSLTSGRFIDNSKMPITHWWRFAWQVSNDKSFNSCAISRDLEITQKSAWLMIDTLKRAMKVGGHEMKNGNIAFRSNFQVMGLLMQVENKKAPCKNTKG